MTRVLPLLMLQLATASMQPSRISPGLGLSNRKVLEQSYYYKSPGGVVYGPFSGEQIDAWWHQGFFPQCKKLCVSITHKYEYPVNQTFDDRSSYFNQPWGTFCCVGGNHTSGTHQKRPFDSAFRTNIFLKDLPAMPESMNSDEFYVYDRSLVSSPFSAFKSRSSRLLSKLNKVKLREIVSNKMSGIRVNPVVSFYLRPHKGSLINTIWMPLLADATLYGLSLFLVGRVAYVLLGLIARVFFDGSLSRQGLLTSGMCSVKIVPYSDISLDMRYSLSDVFKSTLSRFSSMPYQLSSVLAVLAVISLLLRPRLQSACKHAASEWHYHQQLNMPWKGDWLSRLDFSEEGHHSVALIQAVYVLLMSLFAVPFMASANAATSLFYLMSIGSILWQLLSVVLLSTGTAQAKSLENIDNGQNSTIKKLRYIIYNVSMNALVEVLFTFNSLQVQSLENFLVNDDERTIYRWPSLLENIKMTRNRALGSLSRATKYVGSAHDRPLVLLAQILLTITALTKSFTLNDFVSEFGIKNIPSFAQKSSLVAFSGIGFTHLTAINAESLFTIVDIVHRFSISIFIPICLCWQAVSSSTSGIHHVRRLNLLWLSRMPKQSPTPLVHPGLLAESPGTDNDRWATDGPLKQDGIEIDHVTAVGSGRVLLRVRFTS